MYPIEVLLLIGSSLILLSIALTRFSDNLGVPALLIFLGLGMLAGSEGPGGIYFDNAGLAQSVGSVALLFILFAAGLDTSWEDVRPVVREAGILATLGVLLTALAVGLAAYYLLGFTPATCFLLGAIVSSTDAAAVFSVLRSKRLNLSGRLKPLLELESGSNDPIAIFLTVGLIQLIADPRSSVPDLLLLFVLQMSVGAASGAGLGRAGVFLLNRLKFPYEGLYPVFALAFATLIFALTTVSKGSGFLAVYIAGIIIGNSDVVYRKGLLRFFDGMAWLGQIGVFLTLGLLVFPSHLVPVMSAGLLLSGFLMFVARPASVFLGLARSGLAWREKAFISWVGLRGAVPVILATFPLLAGLPDSELIFNMVFFIVLTSALLQAWSIPVVARLLKVAVPMGPQRNYPIEFASRKNRDMDLLDFVVPYNSAVIGKSIVEMGLPKESLIVVIIRNEQFIVPSGGTVIEEGDVVQVLGNKESFRAVQAVLSVQNKAG